MTGNIALALQKFPEATSNQILQAVIRNTGSEPHPLAFTDTFGYGVVVTQTLLASDPTQYPDVNPLITNFTSIVPRVDHIWDLPEEIVNPQDPWRLDIPRPYPIFTPGPEATSNPEASEPAVTPTARADGPDNPAPPASDDDGGLPGWVVPVTIIGVLTLVAIAIIITIVVIRANRSTGGSHGDQ